MQLAPTMSASTTMPMPFPGMVPPMAPPVAGAPVNKQMLAGAMPMITAAKNTINDSMFGGPTMFNADKARYAGQLFMNVCQTVAYAAPHAAATTFGWLGTAQQLVYAPTFETASMAKLQLDAAFHLVASLMNG